MSRGQGQILTNPHLLLGSTLLFWGWQSELLFMVFPALLVGMQPLIPWRWPWRENNFIWVANVSTLMFLVLSLWAMFFQDRVIHVLAILHFLPPILLPLMLVIAYSTQDRISLKVFFFYLRRAGGNEHQATLTKETLASFFAMATLMASGVVELRNPWFYPGASLLLAWGLWPYRQTGKRLWMVLMLLGMGLGYGMQSGLSGMQNQISETLPRYLAQWFMQKQQDSDHIQTDMGEVGQLKQSGQILFQIHPATRMTHTTLLREGCYNHYYDREWTQTNPHYQNIPPGGEAQSWILAPGVPLTSLSITMPHALSQGVLPLPQQAVQIQGLSAASVERNQFGSVRFRGGDLSSMTVMLGEEGEDWGEGGEVEELDRHIPGVEKRGLLQFFKEAGLTGLAPGEVVKQLQGYFADHFQYSLDLEAVSPGQTPLSHFLLSSRKGHCEYYATASVMLLRMAGIPARYCFGYAAHQGEEDGADAFFVRARDAHAWIAFYRDGAWRWEDFTPPDWRAFEHRQHPLWQPLLDGYSTLLFFAKQVDYRPGLWGGMVLAVGWLYRKNRGFRVRGGRKVLVCEKPVETGSPFDAIENILISQWGPRKKSQPLSTWIGRGQGVELDSLLRLHYRLRFDPDGLTEKQRIRFVEEAEAWRKKTMKKRGGL